MMWIYLVTQILSLRIRKSMTKDESAVIQENKEVIISIYIRERISLSIKQEKFVDYYKFVNQEYFLQSCEKLLLL